MSLSGDLVALGKLKREEKKMQEEIKELEAKVITQMQTKKVSVFEVTGIKGTLVEGTTLTLDEEGLKAALPTATWNKITRQVLDKELLEANIVTGKIDADLVASFTEEKPRKPYVRVSGDLITQPDPRVTVGARAKAKAKVAAAKP